MCFIIHIYIYIYFFKYLFVIVHWVSVGARSCQLYRFIIVFHAISFDNRLLRIIITDPILNCIMAAIARMNYDDRLVHVRL